ncbi:MAG: HAD hydrolase-like protein, partial [Methylocella sp.]
GDIAVSLLVARDGAGLFHLGPPNETALFEEVLAVSGKAPRVVPLKQANFVLCTGLADPWRETPADYDAILAAMRAQNLDFICANPDIVVEDAGKLSYCAGALAERYAGAGGKVIQAGKPGASIFARALELAREPCAKTIDRARVLVIGDAMQTDIKGAHDQGFDSLLVTSGIHRKELHGGVEGAALEAAAFRRFIEGADFAPTAAIPELVW